MGNRRLNKIESFHTLAMPESARLKVTALNLLHLTAFPLLQKVGFFILRHSPLAGEGGDGGINEGDKLWMLVKMMGKRI